MKSNSMASSILAALGTLVLAACGASSGTPVLAGPDPGAAGRMSFALSSDALVASGLTDVAAYQVTFYRGANVSRKTSPYFAPGCSKVGADWPSGANFKVKDFAIASDYTIVFDVFSQADCAAGTLAGSGVRGGISIVAGDSGDAYYYIQVNRRGAVTAFPVPGEDLDPTGTSDCGVDADCYGHEVVCADPASTLCHQRSCTASETGCVNGSITLSYQHPLSTCQHGACIVPCVADADCRQEIPCPDASCPYGYERACKTGEQGCQNGLLYVAYALHPLATCDNTVCRLTSLFPLNARQSRAFHAGVATADGQVALLGGFDGFSPAAGATPALLTVSTPSTEGFDGSSSLFSAPTFDGAAQKAAGRAAVVLPGTRTVVLVGGATETALATQAAGPVPSFATCTGDACGLAVSDVATVLDLDAATYVATTLGFSTAQALAVAVPGANGAAQVFIRAGVVPTTDGTGVVPGADAYVCDLTGPKDEGGADQLLCSVLPDQGAPRAGAAGVCLAGTNGLCTSYLVVGGTTDPTSFAELFSFPSGTVQVLAGDSSVTPVTSASGVAAVVAGGLSWTFGGSTGGVPNLAPMQLLPNADGSSISVAQVELNLAGSDLQLLYRLYHQATPLSDGAGVLVSGGIGYDDQPRGDALIFSVQGGQLTYGGRIQMTAARAGHAATLITGGLLDGAVLLSGGLGSLAPQPIFSPGAEIFLP